MASSKTGVFKRRQSKGKPSSPEDLVKGRKGTIDLSEDELKRVSGGGVVAEKWIEM